MVVGTPHEFDGITNGGVHCEGNIAENSLGRGNNDSMGSTSSDATAVRSSLGGGRCPGLRRITVLSHAFYRSLSAYAHIFSMFLILTGHTVVVV